MYTTFPKHRTRHRSANSLAVIKKSRPSAKVTRTCPNCLVVGTCHTCLTHEYDVNVVKEHVMQGVVEDDSDSGAKDPTSNFRLIYE